MRSFAHENAISRDGSRIFWANDEGGHLYVLENETTNVAIPGAGGASFVSVTPNGRYAYYTEAGALWRFDTDSNTSEELEPNAGLQGMIGSSEDGEYVYFVAEGALEPDAHARICENWQI